MQLRKKRKRGLSHKLINYDDVFNRLSSPPLIVNSYSQLYKESREDLFKELYVNYDTDIINNIPKCSCGNYDKTRYYGLICPKCNTRSVYITEKPLESKIWLEVPEGIPGFINPQVWRHLSAQLMIKGFNVLKYVTDRRYYSNKDHPTKYEIDILFDSRGLKRGLVEFYNNFDEIMDLFYDKKIFKSKAYTGSPIKISKDYYRDRVYEYIQVYRDLIFCKRLPIPSELIFVTSENNGTIFTDSILDKAIEAVWTVASIGHGKHSNLANTEHKVVETVELLAGFYQKYEADIIFQKPGIARKLVYGLRPPWSWRNVIVSQHGVHDHTKLIISWANAMITLKEFIANKLLKRGFAYNEIEALISENTVRYNVVLDEIIQELIRETPGGKGIPALFARYPILNRGSIQCFYINQVKTDPTDNTSAISVLCLAPANADFDGDQMAGSISLDNRYSKAYERLAPHLSAMDTNGAFKVSSFVKMPAPIASTIAHWIVRTDFDCPIPDVHDIEGIDVNEFVF